MSAGTATTLPASSPGGFAAGWDAFWFAPAAPLGLRAARVLLAGQALWIVLSRWEIPELAGWPREMWAAAPPLIGLRFGIGILPAALERGLFVLLIAGLAAAVVGLGGRAACALSGALLYHFAPFEEVLVDLPHSSFGGLTLPTVGLLVLAFAENPDRRAPWSGEFRWPLQLLRLLFAFSYFFPGLGKLRFAGLDWFTADNIRSWMVLNYPVTHPPLALWAIQHPAVCWLMAVATFVLELLSPVALFSRRAARVFVAMAVVFHLGIMLTLDYVFLSAPLLLLFLDWDGIEKRHVAP